MPHYKCETCRTRLQTVKIPADPAQVLCPQCGSALSPVADLTELIGWRRVAFADAHAPAGDESAGSSQEPAAAAVAIPPHYLGR
jgi:hypothetical protein